MTSTDGGPPSPDLGSTEAGPVPAPETLLDELDRAEAALAAVEAALGRLDDGAYGRCVSCGAGVDAAILEHDPAAAHCGACRHEHGGADPIVAG
ncbi:MAG: hypothetical protein M0007_10925 [Actinomycetota bacterium]|nr:hypothetical protein [Actinomycetota bacterium]